MWTSKWIEKQVPRPFLASDRVLFEALQHTFPKIIPPSNNEEIMYPLPNVVFRMFDYTDVPERPAIPGSRAIERYLIEELFGHITKTNAVLTSLLLVENCMKRKNKNFRSYLLPYTVTLANDRRFMYQH